jgi:hypothetical protein
MQRMHPNPLPISRRSTVIVVQAVLLALGSLRLQTFPRRLSQWHTMDLLPITVAGPRRPLTGFSIMSLRTPVPKIFIYYLFVLSIF